MSKWHVTHLVDVIYKRDLAQLESTTPCGMAQSTHADFIIVGGGLAGLVIGRRLSELPASRVIILEAGDALDPARSNINMPVRHFGLLFAQGTHAHWPTALREIAPSSV
jgi:choline dehydrogenase-like flavoprotein